jgi:hypothetical protein
MNVTRSLESEAIAEGIESREDLAVVNEMGIRFGQGFLWGRPAPLEKARGPRAWNVAARFRCGPALECARGHGQRTQRSSRRARSRGDEAVLSQLFDLYQPVLVRMVDLRLDATCGGASIRPTSCRKRGSTSSSVSRRGARRTRCRSACGCG